MFCYILFFTFFTISNVNSLLAHDSEKLSLIEANNSVYKHSFICISETFLDYSALVDSEDVNLRG